MLVHGRPRGRDRPETQKYWQFLYKGTSAVTSTTTAAVAGANTQCLSAGIQITLPPTWALNIVNYATDAVDANGTGFLYANTCLFEIQYPSPFIPTNGRKAIPLIAESSMNIQTPSTSGGGLGTIIMATPPPFGLLVNDWNEFDDISILETPVPSVVQVQASWSIFNNDGSNHNIIIGERLAYEVWQLTLMPEGTRRLRDIADIRAGQGYGY